MGVKVLLGDPPGPPAIITADVIRKLRSPEGDKPCPEGLRAGLRWIGSRALPLHQALEEARQRLSSDWVQWASAAVGLSGYGSGYGDGDGYGYGEASE